MFAYTNDLYDKQKQRQNLQTEVDTLLKGEGTSIHDVFRLESQDKQDEVMNQLSGASKTAVKFFTREQTLTQLIELITEMPPGDADHARGHKFPFLASQVFTDGGDGVNSIIERFFYDYRPRENDEVKAAATQKQAQINARPDAAEDTNITGQNRGQEQDNQQEVADDQEDRLVELNPDDVDREPVEVPLSVLQNMQDLVNILDASGKEDEENAGLLGHEEAKQADEQMDKAGKTEDEGYAFEQIMQEFENPANTKKSFEMRLKGDSSDEGEVYIVHDEGADEDQNDLFMQPDDLQFEEDESSEEPKKRKLSSSDSFENIELPDKEMSTSMENPFKDTLANSDILPETKKLDTVIVDNYMDSQASRLGSFTQKMAESKDDDSLVTVPSQQSQHMENIMKRRGRKKQNLSIHQLDETTKKSIADAIQKERESLQETEINSKQRAKSTTVATSIRQNTGMHELVLVENHIKPTALTASNISTFAMNDQNESADDFQVIDDDELRVNIDVDKVVAAAEEEGLNDREETVPADQEIKSSELPILVKTKSEDEEDNILRKVAFKMKSDDNEIDIIRDLKDESSPVSPQSPHDSWSKAQPKFGLNVDDDDDEDQESMEIINDSQEDANSDSKLLRTQDYGVIDKFFSFLNSKDPLSGELNATLCGYFQQVTLILIQREPKEMLKYLENSDYSLLMKLIDNIGNKAIGEIFVKLITDVVLKDQKWGGIVASNNLAESDANLADSQQSQPEKKISDTNAAASEQKNERIGELLLSLVEFKLDEDSDIFEKMGVIDVLTEIVPHNKLCYSTLTTKDSFEVLTRLLVSENSECERFTYVLLRLLISNYERYERFQKRINIDNFEDEELLLGNNSGSREGSGFLNQKSRGSLTRRQNQDVLKEVSESTLFQFIQVVVSNITCEQIQKKYNKVMEAKHKGTRTPLGYDFLELIQFLEKASTIFSGFKGDINQTLVEKDIFNQMFAIMEFYSNSDVLSRTVFRIFENIVRQGRAAVLEMSQWQNQRLGSTKSKQILKQLSDKRKLSFGMQNSGIKSLGAISAGAWSSAKSEFANMMRYMLEETRLVQFLIDNGPKCRGGLTPSQCKQMSEATSNAPIIDSEADQDEESKEENKDVVKELSNSKLASSAALVTSQVTSTTVVPVAGTTALQAHVKCLATLFADLSGEKVKQDSPKIQTEAEKQQANVSQEQQNDLSQQSGDQSKSIEIVVPEGDELEEEELEELRNLAVTMNKVVKTNLTNNETWQKYLHEHIEPINELQKGKLGQTDGRDGDRSAFSDSDIFDQDFLKTLGSGDKDGDRKNMDDDLARDLDSDLAQGSDGSGDQEDHRKFLRSIQKCFQSTISHKTMQGIRTISQNGNCVEDTERNDKALAYASQAETDLTNELRNSLTDTGLGGLGDGFALSLGGKGRSMGRERTTSNDNFSLPPLPADEDYGDVNKDEKISSNYASNSKMEQEVPNLQDLSEIAQIDDEQETSKELTSLADGFNLDDDDIEEVRNPLADDASPTFPSNFNMDIAVKSQGHVNRSDNSDLDNVLGSIESTMARVDKASEEMKSFDAFLLKQEDSSDIAAQSKTVKDIASALEELSPVQAHNKTEDSLELADEQQAKQAEIADIFDQVDQFDSFYNLKDDEMPVAIVNEHDGADDIAKEQGQQPKNLDKSEEVVNPLITQHIKLSPPMPIENDDEEDLNDRVAQLKLVDLDDDRDTFNSFELPTDAEEEKKEVEQERGGAPADSGQLLQNLQMHMLAGADQQEEQGLITWSEMQPPHRQLNQQQSNLQRQGYLQPGGMPLSKSVYVKSENTLEVNQDYADNRYWRKYDNDLRQIDLQKLLDELE